MCLVCTKLYELCNHLDFDNMKPILEKYEEDNITWNVVKCSQFTKK